MRRGTNPVLTFELPEAITISALYITFQQNRQTVLEKDLTAVTYDKENPKPVNLRGRQGPQGAPGSDADILPITNLELEKLLI